MDYVKTVIDRIGTQDIIALILVVVASYLWITVGEIPSTLEAVTLVVVGFFFGDNLRRRSTEQAIAAVQPQPAPPFIEE